MQTPVAVALLSAALFAQQGTVEEKPKHVNRLAKETSPYLLSHKNNPVDWFPWGKEALDKAKRENKPIFLSIGYSACHWCHVMERESFESEAVANVMNRYFVCIKVDREERPDLDEIYMAAVQRMTGQGGWPMSVWLTPDRKPFYGGTYFPPEDKFGRPGFKRLIEGLGEAWKVKEALIEKDAEKMADFLSKSLSPTSPPGKLSKDHLAKAAEQSRERWDREHGGFAAPPHFAPKFPHASELTTLLLDHARNGSELSLQCAEETLVHMYRGGLYDLVGGGFHRYCVDRTWSVPHFEKMLYDNGLLVQTYLNAYQHTGKELYAEVARDTLDYLLREMRHESGGFYSATDADSEGVEGKFFVWTKPAVDRALGAAAPMFCAAFGVTESGNWHEMPGATVLFRAKTVAEVASQFDKPEDEVRASLAASRQTLYDLRQKRVPPLTDDKVLVAWNGMAIAALARGSEVLGDERYLQAAQKAADFVLTRMRHDGDRLHRTWRVGEAKLQGYLEDYGFLADALTHLFEADFDPRWLREAKGLLGVVKNQFRDSDGSLFFTADDHEELVARSKSVQEASTPSGTAMAILAFVRAGLLLADEELVAVGRKALEANHVYLDRAPGVVQTMLHAVDLLVHDPREVVVAGDPQDAATQAMLKTVRATFPKVHVLTLLHDGNRTALAELVPAHAEKRPRDGKPQAFVCRYGACDAPVGSADQLRLR